MALEQDLADMDWNGFKDALIKAKVEGIKASGGKEEDLDLSDNGAIEIECRFTMLAIVKFLTEADFKVTKFNAPIVLEDFRIPDQTVNVEPTTLVADKKPMFDFIKKIAGAVGLASAADLLEGAVKKAVEPIAEGGSTLPSIDIDKDVGGLEATGYTYIGDDPESQSGFDVSEEDGQQDHTNVKLFADDVEDLI